MTRRARLLALSIAISTVSCVFDERSGRDEPLVVRGGRFHPGELPVDDERASPRVTAVELSNGVFAASQLDRSIVGRVSDDAVAVGVRFADVGTGYWVVPAGGAEPLVPGELTIEFTVDVGVVEPGLHDLVFVALDVDGAPGPSRVLEVCVSSPVPDNLNACDDTRIPPAVVVALTWSQDVDLDLSMRSPSGEVLDARSPTGAGDEEIDEEVLDDVTVPFFDADSNGGCAIDGRRREHVVFPEAPREDGTWLVYVDLFDACGVAGSPFRVEVLRRVSHDDGTYSLAADDVKEGHLFAEQATGGAGPPLFVLATEIP